MAKSNAPRSNGEFIHHVNAVRMRLTGSGSLQMQLNSLDDIESYIMVPFDMDTTTSREPTRLANFKSQRIQFEFKTTEIDEYFKIGRIIIFGKPVETSYPG